MVFWYWYSLWAAIMALDLRPFFPLESGLPAKSQLCNDYKLLSTVHVFYLYGHAGLYSMTGETKPIMADPYFPSKSTMT